MGGIYIHIPFCKTKCFYCDFYKTTHTASISLFVDKLIKEIEWRASFFGEEPVETVYLGGGTPSLLSQEDLSRLMNAIIFAFNFNFPMETTIEVNPDDLSVNYLDMLYNKGFNRLSIGVQSFFDEDLKKMGRRHNAEQALDAIKMAGRSHFSNISVDLIYGLPWGNRERINSNISTLAALPVDHISAYHLSIEPDTPFGVRKRKGLLTEITDVESESLFWLVDDIAGKNGFEHYEISSFCKDGKYSLHNRAYWEGKPYLGLGPGAHSFDGKRRLWNRSDLKAYLTTDFDSVRESEVLTEADRLNEMIMLGLRTKWGINIEELTFKFPQFFKKLEPVIKKWMDSGHLIQLFNTLVCTRKGWFVVDGIIEDMFVI